MCMYTYVCVDKKSLTPSSLLPFATCVPCIFSMQTTSQPRSPHSTRGRNPSPFHLARTRPWGAFKASETCLHFPRRSSSTWEGHWCGARGDEVIIVMNWHAHYMAWVMASELCWHILVRVFVVSCCNDASTWTLDVQTYTYTNTYTNKITLTIFIYLTYILGVQVQMYIA